MYKLNVINIHNLPQKNWELELEEYISFSYGDILMLSIKNGGMFQGRISRATAIKYYSNEKIITLAVKRWRPTRIWIIDKIYQLFTQRKMYVFDS